MKEQKKNRAAGVLLPLTMLPGPFGIGAMGREAREFVDLLCDGGFSLWQMLPVEHTGASYSPYKCVSAFAGEPMLIDPRWLLERELITEAEFNLRCEGMDFHSVNYELVHSRQMAMLRSAFARLPEKTRAEYRRFNPFWLDEYALYMAVKEKYDLLPWFEWPDKAISEALPRAIKSARRELGDTIEFYRFVQWAFDAQWRELKEYANARGIKLIGDIPFYVSEDSVEVWTRREMFETDENGDFLAVAGAPPDYFTPDGQRWGNPLYNWDYMKENNYRWWILRMQAAQARFDSVRIDHFRGFESYWRIPIESPTARGGKWVKGPGFKPFEAINRELGSVSVIAEDLGDIGPEVEELLAETGFPGMRVLQFGFMGDARHLPHRYEKNSVAYTGTHDNTTLLSWMYELQPQDRERALLYCGYEGDWGKGGPNCGINRAWIRLMYLSSARMVIVPVQDLLGYGNDTRTNIPGTAYGNWRVRVTGDALSRIDTGFYRQLAELTERLP